MHFLFASHPFVVVVVVVFFSSLPSTPPLIPPQILPSHPKQKMSVKLQSSDEQEFEVEREIAEMSVTIKNMLEDIPETDTAIPLPNVTGKIMQKVIEYCKYHKEHPTPVSDDKKRRKKNR